MRHKCAKCAIRHRRIHSEKTRRKCGDGWYAVAPQFVQLLETQIRVREGLAWVDGNEFVSEADFFDQAHLREQALRMVAKRVAEECLMRTPSR